MPNKTIYPTPIETASSVSLFPSVRAKECTLALLTTLVEWIRGSRFAAVTARLRQLLASGLHDDYRRAKAAELPAVCIAGLCQGGHSHSNITALTALAMVDFDSIAPDAMPALWQRIVADPHTLLAYTSCSGTGFHIVARYSCAEPQVAYTDAWDTCAGYYSVLIDHPADAACKDVTRLCFLNHDPSAFFRPDATPLEVPPFTATNHKPTVARTALVAAHASPLELAIHLVERSGLVFVPGQRHSFLVSLCFYLLKMGVAETEAIAELESRYNSHDEDIAHLVASVYSHSELFNTWQWYRTGPAPKAQADAKRSKGNLTLDVERYVREHPLFRHNVVKHILEQQTDGLWQPATDQSMLSYWLDCTHALGREVRSCLVEQTVQALAPHYDPFRHWCDSLPEWDGTDHIAALFGEIELQQPELMPHLLMVAKRWWVALVASLLDDRVVNHTVLVFTGKQGACKSRFFSSLLPPEWEHYYLAKTDASVVTKDDRLALSSHALVCLEEMNVFTGKNLDQFKGYVTLDAIDERLPYTQHRQRMPRRASLCGCSNVERLLSDPTGERRIIPFAVRSMPNLYERTVPHQQLFAQALALLRDGFRHYLNADDIAILQPTLQRHTLPSLEQQMLDKYYRPARPDDANTWVAFLTLAELHAALSARTLYRLQPDRLALALQLSGFPLNENRKGEGYLAVEITPEEQTREQRI